MHALSKVWFPSAFQNPTAKVQLFCFPFAGGGASAYFRWRELLPSSIELWALELPGHETRWREPLVVEAITLATAIAEQIAAVVDRPFALSGHSMGALLAFETARVLIRDYNLLPMTLFASGHKAPHLAPRSPPIHELPEDQFRNELRLYGGTPEEILKDEDFMGMLSPMLRCDLGLCETYQHATSDCQTFAIVAFGGYEDPIVAWDQLIAWAELTSGEFSAHLMPGGHFYINNWMPQITKLIAAYLIDGKTSAAAAPANDEAHLWIVPVNQPESVMLSCEIKLSPEERKRASSFVQKSDWARSVVSRGALRQILQSYLGTPADAFAFVTADGGKPICEAAGSLAFNVAHSGELVLIGIACDQLIGIDIEEVREDVYGPSLVEQVATIGELEQLATLDPDLRTQAFFDLWVRKEALLKQTGEGLTGLPKAIDVGFSRVFRPARTIEEPLDNRIQSFVLAPMYAAAVAVARQLNLTTIRIWNPSGQ